MIDVLFVMVKDEGASLFGGVYVPSISHMRRRIGSLLLCACGTCDVNCSSAVESLCLVIAMVKVETVFSTDFVNIFFFFFF